MGPPGNFLKILSVSATYLTPGYLALRESTYYPPRQDKTPHVFPSVGRLKAGGFFSLRLEVRAPRFQQMNTFQNLGVI